MDLGQIATVVKQAEEPVTFTVNQLNGEPYTASDGKTPCSWSLLGKESKKYRAARDAITRRNLRSRKQRLEPGELRANRVDLVIAVTTGWSGWEINDAVAECNPENLKTALQYDHILEQCEEQIEGHADFFARNSQT